MKIATQDELDTFFHKALSNEQVYPYMTLTKYQKPLEVSKDNWNDIWLCTDNLNCFVHIIFDRIRDEITIGLWAFDTNNSASGIRYVKEYIKRYKPRALNSIVHSSNKKSLSMHEKIFGYAWGIEELSVWNSLSGEYEDAYYFRKLL